MILILFQINGINQINIKIKGERRSYAKTKNNEVN